MAHEWKWYLVILDVTTSEKPEIHGWEKGQDVRWVTLIPQGGGHWKVEELTQNP
jgi:hypothetical protein